MDNNHLDHDVIKFLPKELYKTFYLEVTIQKSLTCRLLNILMEILIRQVVDYNKRWVLTMWKLWQVVILTLSLTMWIGWNIWAHINKDKHEKDDSCEIEVIFMINAINFILILLILDT